MAAFDVRATAAVIVEEQVEFTLSTLCHASGAEAEQVHALVFEGVLQPSGPSPEYWCFGGQALPATRTALRLGRDLELGMPGVALVMSLLSEIARLRARLPPG